MPGDVYLPTICQLRSVTDAIMAEPATLGPFMYQTALLRGAVIV
jgi:hypothetical protein